MIRLLWWLRKSMTAEPNQTSEELLSSIVSRAQESQQAASQGSLGHFYRILWRAETTLEASQFRWLAALRPTRTAQAVLSAQTLRCSSRTKENQWSSAANRQTHDKIKILTAIALLIQTSVMALRILQRRREIKILSATEGEVWRREERAVQPQSSSRRVSRQAQISAAWDNHLLRAQRRNRMLAVA